MSKRKTCFFTWIMTIALVAISAGLALADPPKVGDKVEIKFGDSWVEATVTRFEDGRVRALTAGGMESWFGPGEFRTPVKTQPGAAEKPAEKPAETKPTIPKTGEAIEVSFAGTWLHAKTLKVDGQRVQAKLDSGWEQWFGPKEYRPIAKGDPKFFAGLQAGSKVEVGDHGRWLPGTVKEREVNRVFIHYDDRLDSLDTWVTFDRVRPRKDAAAPAVKNPGGASASTAPPSVIETASGSVPLGNLSDARQLSSDNDVIWSAKPEAVAAQPAIKSPLALGTKFTGTAEKVNSVQFVGTHVFVALINEEAPKSPRTRIARVRLSDGVAEPVLELTPGQRVSDFSPDGSRALLRRTVGDVSNCLELLTLAEPKPPRELLWKPHKSQDREGELPLAAFIDSSHVLSCDTQGELILWELPANKPAASGAPAPASSGAVAAATRPASQPVMPRPRAVYRMKVDHYFFRPVLSPRHTMFAAEVRGKVRLFNALTGSSLGKIDDSISFMTSVAFNPTCTTLAITTPYRMSFVDLNSGKTLRKVPLPSEFTRGNTATTWLPSGSLLLGHRYLVSPSQRLVLWSYEFPSRSAAALEVHAGELWYVAGDDALALYSVKLPHEEAQRAALNVKVDDLWVFRRGDTVSLDITTDAPGDTRAKIQESLEKQIKEMGLTIGGGGLHIVASTTAGETHPVEYRIARGGGIQQVNVTEKTHELKVELDGKVMWRVSNKSGAPTMISAKEGQTIEDVARETQEKSYGWLATLKIPTDLVRLEGYKAAGSSKVTSRGVE